jgi:hypothetical protein
MIAVFFFALSCRIPEFSPRRALAIGIHLNRH